MFGNSIKKDMKSAAIAAIVIIAIIGIITAGLQLLSTQIHSDSEELYNFVTSARIFHEKIEKTTLLESIPTLVETITRGSMEDPSEIELSIYQGALSARGYRDQFNWLQPTTDSLKLFESLIREGNLINSCYSKLNRLWSTKQAGDESGWEEYVEDIKALYGEVVSLREQNKMELENLLHQFKQGNSN